MPVGHGPKQGVGGPGTIAHSRDRDLRHVRVVGDPGDQFPPLERAVRHHRSLPIHEAAAHLEAYPMLHGELRRAGLNHRRPRAGHLEQFVVRDLLEPARLRDEAGVRREDPFDVRVDLAEVRAERRRQRHRRGVRSTAAERGDLLVVGDPLESGDDDDPAGGQLAVDPRPVDREDAGAGVDVLGLDLGLRPGERDRLGSLRQDRHRQQGDRDLLAGRQQHVQFPGRQGVGDLPGHPDEIVRHIAGRRDDHDDLVAGPARGHDTLRDVLDAVGPRDGGAAELLDDQAHAGGSTTAPSVSNSACRIRHAAPAARNACAIAGPISGASPNARTVGPDPLSATP